MNRQFSKNQRANSYRRVNKENISRHHGPQKLANILADLMNDRGYARQLVASQFHETWQAVLPGLLAKSSRPGRVRNGILEVTVGNSMILQELTFRKKKIIHSLNEELEQKIVDLRFRVGAVD